MDARIAHFEIAVSSHANVPVVGHPCTNVILCRDNHVWYFRIVAFHIVFLGSQVDIHAELEVDIPAVRQEIFAFNTQNVGQTIVIQTVNVQVSV